MASETAIPDRFPKVAAPYERVENKHGDYVVDPDGEFLGVKPEYEWVFDRADEVEAIEKVDGTCMCVYIGEHEHGGLSVLDVATRMGDKSMNRVEPFGPRTNHHYIARGVQNSVRRGYVEWLADEYGGGWYHGECVGPKFQSNPHRLDENLFIPFDWIRDKLEYQSYGKYDTSPSAIRDWFAGEENGLFSLFASRMHGQDLEASRPMNGTFCEGLILVHSDFDGRIRPRDMTVEDGAVNEIVKLRRDMFEQFQNDEWSMTRWGH
jgi:hypothetical protein